MQSFQIVALRLSGFCTCSAAKGDSGTSLACLSLRTALGRFWQGKVENKENKWILPLASSVSLPTVQCPHHETSQQIAAYFPRRL